MANDTAAAAPMLRRCGARARATGPETPLPDAPAAPPVLTPAPAAPAAGAEQRLAACLSGAADPLAQRVLGELTAAERASLVDVGGSPQVLRDAAAVRLRLATALAPDAPASDAAAAQALLAEADALLTALAAGLDEPTSLERETVNAIRRDVVRDAIRVSEAQQRLAAAADAPKPAAPIAARVLSNETADAPSAVEEAPRVPMKLWVTLAIALIAAAGFHAQRFLKAAPELPVVAGAPAGTYGAIDSRSGARVIRTRDRRPLAGAELEKFKAAEAALGRQVREIGPGAYLSEPRAVPGAQP